MHKLHTAKSFDRELDEFKNKISEMGKATGWQLAKALKALAKQDDRLAEETIKRDTRIG